MMGTKSTKRVNYNLIDIELHWEKVREFKKNFKFFNVGNTVRGFEENEEDGLWGYIFEGVVVEAGRYESLVKVHLHYNPEMEGKIIRVDNYSITVNVKYGLRSYLRWWNFIKDSYNLEERSKSDDALLKLMGKYEKHPVRLLPSVALQNIENQFVTDYYRYNKSKHQLYTGKIKCVDLCKTDYFTAGKVYEVYNGTVTTNTGIDIPGDINNGPLEEYYGCETFDSFCTLVHDCLGSVKFEEVTE